MSKSQYYIQQWKNELNQAVSKRGAKAELARHLEKIYPDKTIQHWKNTVSTIVNTDRIPSGELVLAINDWITKQHGS